MPQERFVSKCTNCSKTLPIPVNLWADGVCKLSRGFCDDCGVGFTKAYKKIGREIEDEGFEYLRREIYSGYNAGAGS
jgi:hypothetical protein